MFHQLRQLIAWHGRSLAKAEKSIAHRVLSLSDYNGVIYDDLHRFWRSLSHVTDKGFAMDQASTATVAGISPLDDPFGPDDD